MGLVPQGGGVAHRRGSLSPAVDRSARHGLDEALGQASGSASILRRGMREDELLSIIDIKQVLGSCRYRLRRNSLNTPFSSSSARGVFRAV